MKKNTQISKERQDFGEMLCRAIAPDAWAEYDDGKGVCTNSAGFRIVESINAAGRIIAVLEKNGYPVPAKNTNTPVPSKNMKK